MTRLLLVLVCLATVLVGLAAMALGWRNRARRQAGLPTPPATPADPGPARLDPLPGLYVGTTYARCWQDRVVVHGLGRRAAATATLHESGVMIDRDGAPAVFLPAPLLAGARLEPALAGKVVGEGGLLVINWRLGGTDLDTGFRADDKSAYPSWVREINERTMV